MKKRISYFGGKLIVGEFDMKRICIVFATILSVIWLSACQQGDSPWEKVDFTLHNGDLYYKTYDNGKIYRLNLTTEVNQKLKIKGNLFERDGDLYLFNNEKISILTDKGFEELGSAPKFNTYTLIGVLGTTYYYASNADIWFWDYDTSIKGSICHVPSGNYDQKVALNEGNAFFVTYDGVYEVHIFDGTCTKIIDDKVTDIKEYNGIIYYAVDNPSETITNIDGTYTYYDNGYSYYSYIDGKSTCLMEVESSSNKGNFTISDGHILTVGNSNREVGDNKALYSYDILNATVETFILSEGVETDGAIVSDDDYIVFADEYGRKVWKYDMRTKTLNRLFGDKE